MTPENRAAKTGKWLSTQGRSPNAQVRLFCLPHAGAGTAGFNLWKRLLPDTIEVCPIQIPGRESRLSEDSCTDCGLLIDQMTRSLQGEMDKPYAIFGHSMGALLALDLAQSLRAAGHPAPRHLFVSGRNATHISLKQSNIHRLSDAEFVDALAARYGGLPQEILETPELLELYLPILRADITLLETHIYREKPPLDCPISAFAGAEDRNVSAQGLGGWGEHTTGAFEEQRFAGDHFYLSGPSRPMLLDVIAQRLADPFAAATNIALTREMRDGR